MELELKEMEMLPEKYFIINNEVVYCPRDNRLSSLHSAEVSISINAPVSRCFLLLMEHPKEVVSRDDFLEIVWNRNGAHVSQNTFYQNISLLRKALKSVGLTEDIIVTVRKKGFALSSKVKIEYVQYLPSSLLPVESESNASESLPVDEVNVKYYKKLNKKIMMLYSDVKYLLVTSIVLLFFILNIVSVYMLASL